MILEAILVGPMQANCYVLAPREGASALIIDPGDQARKIKKALVKHKLQPAFIINTHGHYDHIGADDFFGVPVYVHRLDEEFLKDASVNLSKAFALPYEVSSEIRLLEDGMVLELEGLQLQVLHIPGHTPGGISLRLLKPSERIVFTGDTLFRGGIGRSDLAGGNEAVLIKAIREKLLSLPDDTVVYPGHGPFSTIGEERRRNPFLL